MLKSELIKKITSLPTTCSLFSYATKIQSFEFASDTEFRDSILKQYQFRKSNFEIVKFEDLNETIKNQIFSILSSRVHGTSKTARDFVCNYVKSLCDLTFKFLKALFNCFIKFFNDFIDFIFFIFRNFIFQLFIINGIFNCILI